MGWYVPSWLRAATPLPAPRPEFEPWGIGRLNKERHAIRGTARALLQAEDVAIVQGEANTNECPVGSAAISGEEECQQAADVLGIELKWLRCLHSRCALSAR